MNTLSHKQAKYLGITLITLGIFAMLKLWWILPILMLVGGGIYLYIQRRKTGRINEAVQFGLWGIGIALLTMLKFFFPGILLLAGVSVLLRNRENQVDRYIQQWIAQFGLCLHTSNTAIVNGNSSSSYPHTPVTKVTIVDEEDKAAMGETIRLK